MRGQVENGARRTKGKGKGEACYGLGEFPRVVPNEVVLPLMLNYAA